MAMTLQALNAALDKGLTAAVDHATLAALVDAVATHARDAGLRGRCKALADGNGAGNPMVFNVLCAGLFGLVPGDSSLRPAEGGEYLYRVNPFLHGVRKAILACKALDSVRQNNGRSYVFYPEFLGIESLRKRVAALARAHAGMGPKNDELTVLYSLAGFFGLSDASRAVKVVGSGGTTCIMTARAVYHAAGCSMIGDRPPTVNTPLGASVELGVPALTKRTVQNKLGQWIEEKIAKVTIDRGDITESGGKVFNENNKDHPPHLEVGDIYFVDGDGDHKFLMRGGGALAGHVGIVVEKNGEAFRTVDGGSGMGADINLSKQRKMYFKDGVGWTFSDSSSSFSATEVAWIDLQMRRYAGDAAMEQAILTESMFAGIKPNLLVVKMNIETAANEKLHEMHKKTLATVLENGRRLKRQYFGTFTGEVRTIQGWWNPQRYPAMQPVTGAAVQRLLAA